MSRRHDRDEYLEALWSMHERELTSLEELRKQVHVDFDEDVFRTLEAEGLTTTDDRAHTVRLTAAGMDAARHIIRAHRLAERLIRDVLGSDFENAAGEFEHTISPELVDSICTLLGHPGECPHGKPIPPGACCQREDRAAPALVIPLTELGIGETAEIAYVQCRDDREMHRLDGLQLRPGTAVKLHQKYPAFVIECEGMSIALDRRVTSNIKVWVKDRPAGSAVEAGPGGFRFRRRGRHGSE